MVETLQAKFVHRNLGIVKVVFYCLMAS